MLFVLADIFLIQTYDHTVFKRGSPNFPKMKCILKYYVSYLSTMVANIIAHLSRRLTGVIPASIRPSGELVKATN